MFDHGRKMLLIKDGLFLQSKVRGKVKIDPIFFSTEFGNVVGIITLAWRWTLVKWTMNFCQCLQELTCAVVLFRMMRPKDHDFLLMDMMASTKHREFAVEPLFLRLDNQGHLLLLSLKTFIGLDRESAHPLQLHAVNQSCCTAANPGATGQLSPWVGMTTCFWFSNNRLLMLAVHRIPKLLSTLFWFRSFATFTFN